MPQVAKLAEQVRKRRKPASDDNPLVALQEKASQQIVDGFEAWRKLTEALSERIFLAVYGSPALQAAVGIGAATDVRTLRRAAKSPLHSELLQKRIDELKAGIPAGGLREAVIRALIYAGMKRDAIDERGFEMARRIRQAHGDLPLPEFKKLVRDQFYMLLIDQEAALAALPEMLPPDADTRAEALGLIKQVLTARGGLSAEEAKRMNEIEQLFDLNQGATATVIPIRQNRKGPRQRPGAQNSQPAGPSSRRRD
jgi:hypothetical protein